MTILTLNYIEEDETTFSLKGAIETDIDRQRVFIGVIGGYPASCGGLDSGSPNAPLFDYQINVKNQSFFHSSSIKSLKVWRRHGYEASSNVLVLWLISTFLQKCEKRTRTVLALLDFKLWMKHKPQLPR